MTKQPFYLYDFHCSLLTSKAVIPQSPSHTLYPLSSHISYDSLSPNYKNLILNIYTQVEPQFYHQVVCFSHWRTTMKVELDAMEANHT